MEILNEEIEYIDAYLANGELRITTTSPIDGGPAEPISMDMGEARKLFDDLKEIFS